MENKKTQKSKISNEAIANLCKEVNAFDKEFGIKLKKIDPYGEPEMVFQSYVDSFRTFLLQTLCEINGISPDAYLSSETEDDETDRINFTNLSNLEWDEKKVYDVNSMEFKLRFLTVFLSSYMEKLEKIAVHKYNYLSMFKSGIYENAYFHMKGIADDTRAFIKIFLYAKTYGNIFLKMNQNCSYIKTKKTDPLEINKYIFDIRRELKNGLKDSLFVEKDMPEDIAINAILQLAYLISTGDTSLKNLPNFKDIEGANTTYELRGLIEALGDAILRNCKYDKRPLLRIAFDKARPSLRSKYNDINENRFINAGVRALEYTKFFCNDKYITKFINKMM